MQENTQLTVHSLKIVTAHLHPSTSGLLPHPVTHTAPHPGPLLPSPSPPGNLPSHRAPQTTPRHHHMNNTSESAHLRRLTAHLRRSHTWDSTEHETGGSYAVERRAEEGRPQHDFTDTGVREQSVAGWWRRLQLSDSLPRMSTESALLTLCNKLYHNIDEKKLSLILHYATCLRRLIA